MISLIGKRLRGLLGQGRPETDDPIILSMPSPGRLIKPEPNALRVQGYVDVCTVRNATGWMRNLAEPEQRLAFEVIVKRDGERTVVQHGVADGRSEHLRSIGVGDGQYAFNIRFDPQLTVEERDSVEIVALGAARPIEVSTALVKDWRPVNFIAMDIVDNCNLRCPFCLYDYTDVRRTNAMDPEVFASTLRFMPYTGPGNFWLSCLHEPTLHPQFERFVETIPQVERDKIFFTSNLAKKMPASYYDMLANSGAHVMNISIESFEPALYERMRKGAKFSIFNANWDILLQAFRRGSAPPRIRYIIMAYKSNLRELPGMVKRLRAEKDAWQVEVRYTFPQPHIPAAFSGAEFLEPDEWAWLQQQLGGYNPMEVVLTLPPEDEPIGEPASPAAEPEDEANAAPLRFSNIEMHISWNGMVRVHGAREPGRYHIYAPKLDDIDVRTIADPAEYIGRLVA